MVTDACLEGDNISENAQCNWVVAPKFELLSGQQGTDPKTEEAKNQYRLLKELLEKFCELPQPLRDDAAKNGLKVAGTGNNVFWVFTKGFAVWVGNDCDHLMKLFSQIE
jgi:hypothetical protein